MSTPSITVAVRFLACCIFSGACLGATPEDAAPVAPTAVDGVTRPADLDLIQLANGDELRGRILNESFTLHTPYGSLALGTELLAGIAFHRGPEQLDRISTIHYNRLSGFLNEPIRFQSGTDDVRTLQKTELQGIVFHRREDELSRAATRRFVVLRNGDLLSGGLRDWVLESAPGSATVPPPLDAIEIAQFTEGSEHLHLVLRNGQEQTMKLPGEHLALELDAGPEIRLPVPRVKAVFARAGTVPLLVRREFESAGDASTDAGLEAPAPTPDDMVWIPPGRFLMGSMPGEPGHGTDENPVTEVVLSQGYWLGRHEVTQAEWTSIMGPNPSGFQGLTNHPIERVTWNEARAYCLKKTTIEREAGRLPEGYVYRLPTEAEWEYACRAGTTTRYGFGDDPEGTELSAYGWFINNSDSSTRPVGALKPNAWGLYDMHGNVWEWCQDLWQDAYPGGTVTNYTGPQEGWLRVARGGSWLYDASFCRSANRDNYGPDNRCSDIGFRVVLGRPL